MSVNSLLNIGTGALTSNQAAISVTGNNVANVNTEGYSRQSVRFEERWPVNKGYGQLGQGVNVAEVYRNFNRFVEDAFLERSSQQQRWHEQGVVLNSVQSLFNEANTSGVGTALTAFFDDWSNLHTRPDDAATRESLLANADNLTKLLGSTRDGLEAMQKEMDMYIAQSVREINEALEGIKELNRQITATEATDNTNANQLRDQRDMMVRKLATLIDIEVIDRGHGDFAVTTTSGLPLVDGQSTYPLEMQSGRVENMLQKNSGYDGTIIYEGEDAHEYTFEVVNPPVAGDPAAPGTMRVSLDGGKTWLRNEDGSEMLVRVPSDPNERVKVKNLTISFDADTTNMVAGDSFSVMPKSGIYWSKPTREPLNITPQTFGDGAENTGRVVGGKLAAYFTVRDENIGKYIDKLDALANSLAWEVNRIHSQGAGKTMTHTLGSYPVADTDLPLGLTGSGLAYAERLTSGNLTIQMYDGKGDPGQKLTLDMDPDTDGAQNFDPSKHSLEDVVNAINRTGTPPGSAVKAAIVDGKLQLTSVTPGTSFAFGDDSTGLLAALGINTFFHGSSSSDLSLKSDIVQERGYINASKVGADGKIKEGDNETAKALSELATKAVSISTGWEHSTQSLTGYYAGTVSRVGAETRTAQYNDQYNTALANDLDGQCAAISGVNLDEEMASLIKFQHSYTAAAKLITTADQMLQTLLGLKQ